MTSDVQTPFEAAVVVPTVVRPTLGQAIHSVYAQAFDGRIQILIGIDRWVGERAYLDGLIAEAPSHVAVTVVDLGYSTSQRHGGLYPSSFGGALKTILSYAANSRHVAYLDDDNWYASDHLASMRKAISGKAWAFALRTFVDSDSGEVLCPDTWESVGPGRGVHAAGQGGFVDTNSFLLDKFACDDVLSEWALTRYHGGTGGDRQVLARLSGRPWGTNGAHTVYYRQRLVGHHPYLLWRLKCAGVDLARFMPQETIPDDRVWQQCAEHDRRLAQAEAATGQPAPTATKPVVEMQHTLVMPATARWRT